VDKISQKGFAPIIFLVIGAIIALVVIKPLQKSVPTAVISPQSNQIKATLLTLTDAEQQQNLEKYLTVEAALLGVADNISLYFKDLDHGKQFSIEPTKSWIPASTIKTYVVLEAFRQRDLGLINFDNEVTISSSNVVSTELETDEFPRLREGEKATIRQLVEAMIIQSDNTAYNTLLDILDRRNVNAALKSIGLTETVVGEKLNLDDNQFQTDLQALGRQPNTTTVKDLASFFDLLYNKKIADSDEIIGIFKRQKINNMIPALLPSPTEVAHKTGNWASIYHDGGVVFKPNDPFVLTVFTNTGDPNVVAKLARVAYFQTPDSVGQPVSFNNQPDTNHFAKSPYDKIALNEGSSSDILGETTDSEKFPAITAADLGINQKDLSISPKEAQDLQAALITPGSFLYGIKTFIREKQLQNATDNSGKAKVYLDLARDKLAEVKSLLEKGDVAGIGFLLDQSEQDLAKATELAQNDPNKDLLLVQIKQVNDLHFAVLNEKAQQLPSQDKEKFIDTVYNFYQKDKKDVTTVVNTSVIANATQQKPAIGTVTQVKDGTATLQFDDGTKKDVLLNDGAKVRSFQQDTYQSPSSIATGDKIAVIGITNNNAKIVPEFILKNVPKELPNKHTGTVIEIKPDENTLKILNQKGQEETIKVSSNTVVQSKDTNVSLGGIMAGSQITVFGVVATPPASSSPPFSLRSIPFFGNSSSSSAQTTSSPSPAPANAPKIPQASTTPSQNNQTNTKTPAPTVNTTPKPTPTSKQPTVELKATSVTVTSNGSGKNEIVQPKKPAPSQPKPPPQSQPAKQPETKPQPPTPAKPSSIKK